jgi:hypothetical protein
MVITRLLSQRLNGYCTPQLSEAFLKGKGKTPFFIIFFDGGKLNG